MVPASHSSHTFVPCVHAGALQQVHQVHSFVIYYPLTLPPSPLQSGGPGLEK